MDMNTLKIKSRIFKIAKVIAVAVCLCFSYKAGYAAFEDIEVGPRATALGGAFVSQGDDITGMYYNPAGLVGLRQPELMTSHEKLYWGLSDDSSLIRDLLGVGGPVIVKGKYYGSVGLSWNLLSLKDFYKEEIIMLGYGYPVREDLWLGVNMRKFEVGYEETLYTKINPVFDNGYDKSAYGFDIGGIYKVNNINLGMSILNVNEPDMGLKYTNKIDRKINLGLSYKKEALDLNFGLNFFRSDVRLKAGAELWLFDKQLICRGGLNLGSRDYRNVAVGLGYDGKWYRIDYSFLFPLSGIVETAGHHQLGATYRWGGASGRGLERRDALVKGLPGGVSVPITPEEKEEAQDLAKQARIDVKAGLYHNSLEKLNEADRILVDDEEVKELIAKIELISEVFPALLEKDKKAKMQRRAIDKYLAGEGELAVYIVTYANQLWKNDSLVKSLKDVIVNEFPEQGEKMILLEGVTIVEQLQNDVLVAIREGRFTDAIHICEKILKIDPNNIKALIRMGSAYWAMGREDTARNIWRKVLKLDPGNRQIIEFLNKER